MGLLEKQKNERKEHPRPSDHQVAFVKTVSPFQHPQRRQRHQKGQKTKDHDNDVGFVFCGRFVKARQSVKGEDQLGQAVFRFSSLLVVCTLTEKNHIPLDFFYFKLFNLQFFPKLLWGDAGLQCLGDLCGALQKRRVAKHQNNATQREKHQKSNQKSPHIAVEDMDIILEWAAFFLLFLFHGYPFQIEKQCVCFSLNIVV
ncbi:MAG: hypothetical protein H6728_04785 [Myxococcales bacterium]|nr:hypothetical protein [Myxococcales bacterium]MCB9642368.1 hypothetical protein [Myxococcales bacterium]